VVQRVLPNPQGRTWKVTTAEYSYTYLLPPGSDDDWLLRYDYVPEEAANPEYKYPVAHVHFNGTSEPYDNFKMPEKKPLPKIHFPTGRIALEDFIEYLIIEHKVPTQHDEQEALALLAESREEFHKKRRTR
jgi:hypothetical protein